MLDTELVDWLITSLVNWWIDLFQVCSESMRFEKLMEHFKNEDDNIDFLVQWIEVVWTVFNIILN